MKAEDDELMGDISAVLANLNIDGAESAATVAAEAWSFWSILKWHARRGLYTR
jgi:hypothetical protein